MESLPRELIFEIVEYLDIVSLSRFFRTCKWLLRLLSEYRQVMLELGNKTIFCNKKLLKMVYSQQKFQKFIVICTGEPRNLKLDLVLRFVNFDSFYKYYGYYCDFPNIESCVLLDPLFDIYSNSQYGFLMACFLGHVQIAKTLIEKTDIDPSNGGDEAIRLAALNGHVNTVKLLLKDARVNPCARDNCAIRWAASKGHSEIVQVLLKDPRVDPSAEHNSALVRASQNRHFEIMNLLSHDDRIVCEFDIYCHGDFRAEEFVEEIESNLC